MNSKKVQKSPIIPTDAYQGYARDLERLVEMKAQSIEDEINDEIEGLKIERDFLSLVYSAQSD